MPISRSNTYEYETSYQTDDDDDNKDTDGESTVYTFHSEEEEEEDEDDDEQRDDVDDGLSSSSIDDDIGGRGTFDETLVGDEDESSYSVASIGDETFQDILESEKAVDENFPSMFMVLPSTLLMAAAGRGGACRPLLECSNDGEDDDSLQQGMTDEDGTTDDDEDVSTDCDTDGEHTVDDDDDEEEEDDDQTVEGEDILKVYNLHNLRSFDYFQEDNQEGLADGDDDAADKGKNDTDKELATLERSNVSKEEAEDEEPTKKKKKKKQGKRRNFIKVRTFAMNPHQQLQKLIARRKSKKNKKRLKKEESMASSIATEEEEVVGGGVQEEVELQFEDDNNDTVAIVDEDGVEEATTEVQQEENTQDDQENKVMIIGDVIEDREGDVEEMEAREDEDTDVEDRNEFHVWSKHDTRNGENVELHVKDDGVIMVEIDGEKAEVSCPMLSSNGKRDTNGFWFARSIMPSTRPPRMRSSKNRANTGINDGDSVMSTRSNGSFMSKLGFRTSRSRSLTTKTENPGFVLHHDDSASREEPPERRGSISSKGTATRSSEDGDDISMYSKTSRRSNIEATYSVVTPGPLKGRPRRGTLRKMSMWKDKLIPGRRHRSSLINDIVLDDSSYYSIDKVASY